MNRPTNVEKKDGYDQVCIWPGTLVGEKDIELFEKFFLKEFGTRVQYLESIVTKPDVGDFSGETGGREDVFFTVHKDDIEKFTIPRFRLGIKWIEDVLSSVNGYDKNPIYPNRVMEYKIWDADESFTNEGV